MILTRARLVFVILILAWTVLNMGYLIRNQLEQISSLEQQVLELDQHCSEYLTVFKMDESCHKQLNEGGELRLKVLK